MYVYVYKSILQNFTREPENKEKTQNKTKKQQTNKQTKKKQQQNKTKQNASFSIMRKVLVISFSNFLVFSMRFFYICSKIVIYVDYLFFLTQKVKKKKHFRCVFLSQYERRAHRRFLKTIMNSLTFQQQNL